MTHTHARTRTHTHTHRQLTALAQNKLQRDANLNEEAGRYWAEILDRRYQFDVAHREVCLGCWVVSLSLSLSLSPSLSSFLSLCLCVFMY